MPYVNIVEGLAEQRGLEEGLLAGIAAILKSKFGAADNRLMPKIRKLHDVARLRTILDAIPEAQLLDEIRQSLR